MKVLRTLLAVVFLFVSIISVHGADGTISLSLDAEKFVYGIQEFHLVDVSPENEYLSRSLPMALIQSLQGLERHFLGSAEKEMLRERLLRDAVLEAEKQLNGAYTVRDQLLFKKSDEAELARSEAAISEHYQSLEYLYSLNTDDIAIPDELALEAHLYGDDNPLIPAGQELEKIDFLITGVLEEVEGFLYFTLTFENLILNEIVYTFEGAGSDVNLDDYILDGSRRIKSLLYGQEWAALTLEASAGNSIIYFDDTLTALGRYEEDLMVPGEYTVRIEASGYKTRTERVSLAHEQEYDLFFELEKDPLPPMVIQSIPSGASVYIESQYFGVTPLVVESAGNLQHLSLSLEGYQDWTTVLGITETEVITASLLPAVIDKADFIGQKRDEYYDSLAAFSLSVPATMLMFGLSENFLAASEIEFAAPSDIADADAAKEAFEQEVQVMKVTGGVFTGLFYAGILTSVTLLINMFIEMMEYVGAIDF